MVIAQAGRYAPFIEVEPGVKLFIEDSGSGALGTLVFIHGWTMSNKAFEYQFQYLAPLGYRCIGIDLRGFGHSDKPWGKYNYDVFAADIRTVLATLQIDNAVLCGHSMGGAIALQYVAQHKAAGIKKLVLIGAAAPSFVQRPDYAYGIERSAVDSMIQDCLRDRAKLLTRFGEMCFAKSVSPAFARWFHSIAMNASPYATVRCLEALRDLDLRTYMEQIKVPTLIMHGSKDQITPFALAERLHKGIEGSQLVRFEDSGHCVFYEDLVDFNERLMEFVGS